MEDRQTFNLRAGSSILPAPTNRCQTPAVSTSGVPVSAQGPSGTLRRAMAHSVRYSRKLVAIGVTLVVLILSANPATAASSNQNEPAASNGVVSEACKVISYVDEFDSLKNIVRLLSDGDSKSSVLGTVISAIDYLACPLAAIERPALRLRTSLQSMYHFEPPRATYDPVGVPSVCFSSSGPNVMWVQWLQTTVGAQPTTVEIEWKYADSGFWSSPSVLSYTAGFHEDWARSYVGSPSTSVDVRISATAGVWLYSLPTSPAFPYCSTG